jgi:hypothetical protein
MEKRQRRYSSLLRVIVVDYNMFSRVIFIKIKRRRSIGL